VVGKFTVQIWLIYTRTYILSDISNSSLVAVGGLYSAVVPWCSIKQFGESIDSENGKNSKFVMDYPNIDMGVFGGGRSVTNNSVWG